MITIILWILGVIVGLLALGVLVVFLFVWLAIGHIPDDSPEDLAEYLPPGWDPFIRPDDNQMAPHGDIPHVPGRGGA